MFDIFFIFSALFLRTESRGGGGGGGVRFLQSCSQNAELKIAADKVNIMECDPESTSVTSKFFPKSNSVHYYALTMKL